MRRTLPALLGFAALVLSPHAACTDDDAGLSPAQVAALRDSVEGTWEYTDGATTIQMRMSQSARDFDTDDPYASLSLVGDAHACGNHGLVKPASACFDMYFMPLDVEIIAGTAPDSRATLVSTGEIWIKLDATELRGRVVGEAIALNGTATLRRIAR